MKNNRWSKEEISSNAMILKSLLKGMDIPVFRKNDIRWMSRNIAVRNKDHKNFKNASDLILEFISQGIVKIN